MHDLFVFRDVDLITIVRVMLAFVLGGVVGFERQRVRQPAGLRTHMLLCAGSACFTIASVYGFEGLGSNPDPGRLAAQIISGIGFLGAGAIFRTGASVRGLTTAASIWVTASIGIVAGLGMLWLAVFTTALTWFALDILKNLESRGQAARGTRPQAGSTRQEQDDLD